MNLEISKSTKYLIIGSIVFAAGISTVLLVLVKGYSFSSQNDPDNIESSQISSVVSVDPFAYSNDTIKGYLKNQEGLPQFNKTVTILVNNIIINKTVINKNTTVGNAITDNHGCYYFDSWDTANMNDLISELDNKTHLGNVIVPATIVFKSSFAGDGKLLPSFNLANASYENMFGLAGPERVYIRVLLANGENVLSNLELHRGHSYNYTMEVLVGDFHRDLKMDIRNLPCGVTVSLPEDANLTSNTQTIIPVNIIVDKDAMVGHYPASIYAQDPFGQEYNIASLEIIVN